MLVFVAVLVWWCHAVVGIGAGVESMSLSDMMGAVGDINDRVLENPLAQQCLNPMGITWRTSLNDTKLPDNSRMSSLLLVTPRCRHRHRPPLSLRCSLTTIFTNHLLVFLCFSLIFLLCVAPLFSLFFFCRCW